MASDNDAIRKDIEELRTTLSQLTADVSSMSRSLAGDAKSRASRKVGELRESAAEAASEIGAKGREGTEAVENAIRERPFQSLLVAFGAGVLLAQMMRRQ